MTKAARRRQIVAATVDTIAELGYSQTSFARIAERAGLSSTRLISYHFMSKRELLQEVVRSGFTAGAQYVAPRIEAERTAPAMLVACLRANVEFIRDHGNQVTAINEIMANLRATEDTLPPSGSSRRDEQVLRGIEAILSKGQAEGEFRDFDIRTMAWVIRSAIDGVAQQRAVEPAFDFGACIRELTDLFDHATTRTEAR